MTQGIPASELNDDDLTRELAQLDRTRDDIEISGTEQQQHNHVERSRELRDETQRRSASDDRSQ